MMRTYGDAPQAVPRNEGSGPRDAGWWVPVVSGQTGQAGHGWTCTDTRLDKASGG